MARDESRDVYVQRDCDGNFVGLATYLQSYEMFEEQSPDDAIVRYVPHDQLEAAEKRIAELERDSELERSRWRPLQQWSQSECDSGRAEPGESCFATALKRIYAQEKRIAELKQELTLAKRADNWCTKTPCPDCPPRCKDGCGHWRAPLGEFFQHAACMHKSGLKLPNDDGSDSCSNHSKLQK